MDEDNNSRLARIEAILPTLATKADLESLRGDIARWMLVTAVGFFVFLCSRSQAAMRRLPKYRVAVCCSSIHRISCRFYRWGYLP